MTIIFPIYYYKITKELMRPVVAIIPPPIYTDTRICLVNMTSMNDETVKYFKYIIAS